MWDLVIPLLPNMVVLGIGLLTIFILSVKSTTN